MLKKVIATNLILLFVVLSASGGASNQTIQFTDITEAAGIVFVRPSAREKRYVVESISAGVALLDFNNDGLLDIYLVNALTVENPRGPSPSALFRNRGDGTFVDVAAKAGVAHPGWGMGVAVADVDNDGWLDLYVTCFGPNRLYLNRGDGTFRDGTGEAKVGDPGCGQGAAFGDYDNDGDVDLYIANYVEFDLNKLPEFGKGHFCHYRGIPVQCGPRGLPGGQDVLYRNEGDGTFVDVTREAKVLESERLYGMGVVWADLDKDGRLDLYVANDTQANYLYRNLGDGTFREVGLESGVAVAQDGSPQGSMGVAIGDYDRDGWSDIFVTNYADQYHSLYRQDRAFFFSDVSFGSRIAASSFPFVGWGAEFVDFDNDGWSDLIAVNSHVYPQIEQPPVSVPYRQRCLLYRNNGDNTFSEVTAQTGDPLMKMQTSRGAAFGDIDNDGDVDAIINNLDGGPMLIRNDGGDKSHWLLVKTEGTRSNRAGVGARVKVVTTEGSQEKEVRSGSSYLSHNDLRLHFGLGKEVQIKQMEVRWPSGAIDYLKDIEADQILTIREGDHPAERRPE